MDDLMKRSKISKREQLILDAKMKKYILNFMKKIFRFLDKYVFYEIQKDEVL